MLLMGFCHLVSGEVDLRMKIQNGSLNRQPFREVFLSFAGYFIETVHVSLLSVAQSSGALLNRDRDNIEVE